MRRAIRAVALVVALFVGAPVAAAFAGDSEVRRLTLSGIAAFQVGQARGDRPTIVVVPGWMDSAENHVPRLRRWAGQGQPAVAINVPGLGAAAARKVPLLHQGATHL